MNTFTTRLPVGCSTLKYQLINTSARSRFSSACYNHRHGHPHIRGFRTISTSGMIQLTPGCSTEGQTYAYWIVTESKRAKLAFAFDIVRCIAKYIKTPISMPYTSPWLGQCSLSELLGKSPLVIDCSARIGRCSSTWIRGTAWGPKYTSVSQRGKWTGNVSSSIWHWLRS